MTEAFDKIHFMSQYIVVKLFTADLVLFTIEIINGTHHFLCSAILSTHSTLLNSFYRSISP